MNEFLDLQRRKNLSNEEGYTKALEIYNKQKAAYDNPKSIQELMNLDPNTYLVIAPPVDIYYNRDKAPILKAKDDRNKEIGQALFNRAIPVAAVGETVANMIGVKPLDYVVIKRGSSPEHDFYFDNVQYLAFSNHTILLTLNEENRLRFTNGIVEIENND